MTSHEAQDQIREAMRSLKSVRDALGEQLSVAKTDMALAEGEMRRISDLHGRVARAIQAYS